MMQMLSESTIDGQFLPVPCSSCTMVGSTFFTSPSSPTQWRYIVKIWQRLNGQPQVDAMGEDEVNLTDNAVETPPKINFLQHLQQAVKKQCEDKERKESGGDTIKELRDEMRSFKKTKIRGVKLEMMYHNMKGIQVSSVESERSFSVAGRYCNKMRSSLGDESLNCLTLLHYYNKQIN